MHASLLYNLYFFFPHNEKGLWKDSSEHPAILLWMQEARSISMFTHVLYTQRAGMAEHEVTWEHAGALARGGIPGRGSVGAVELALLFSPCSDSVLVTLPPSPGPVSLPAELKGSSCCFLFLGSHLDTTALLCIFMPTKWPQPQGSRTLPGEICMEQKSKTSATQKNSGAEETRRYHYEKEEDSVGS